ncbi:uncharacterized protein LOC62_07G009797 [Vanrija pseudolonga]|uniref:Uncharacterized protein n=1 Tax=Vanrija pseudolonga TaxID=143232 RepID=A0AAF0YJ99_9TREE|nr:hypothetical protein LOC62_07G009797 [Vanrija pseudolonga]
MVIVYDCLALQIIKDYQSVFYDASLEHSWVRSAVVGQNSIIIGYGAQDGAPRHTCTSCGTRLTLALEGVMVVLDIEKVLLPVSDDPPPVPLTLIAEPVDTTMSHDAIYQTVPLNGVQEAEYRTARAHGRFNPDSAAARHNAMMAPWQAWWSEADCAEYREVRNAPQPPCKLCWCG